MIKFKKVTIKNFMSFGNAPTEISLDEKQTVMILGNNEDVGDQGTSRNGVGKTTVIQAIIYALYGRGIDKQMKADDFINFVNEKNLVVELSIEVNGQPYFIRRARKPNAVELYSGTDADGGSLTRDTMKNTDDAILDVIGVPYDVFIGVFFLSPHKDSFMAMGTADQRSFIESVLSLDVLAKRAETIKAIRKDAQAQLTAAQRNMEMLTASNTRTNSRIQELSEQSSTWATKQAKHIADEEEILQELQTIDVAEQQGIFRQIDAHKAVIDAVYPKMMELNASLSKNAASLSGAQRDLSTWKVTQQKHDNHETDVIAEKIRIETEIHAIESKNDLNQTISDLNNKADRLSEIDRNINSLSSESKQLELSIERNADKMEKIDEEIASLLQGQCPYCKQSHVDEDRIAELTKQAEDIATKAESDLAVFDDKVAQVQRLSDEAERVRGDLGSNYRDVIRGAQDKLTKISRLEAQLESAQKSCEAANPHALQLDEFVQKYDNVATLENIIVELQESIRDIEAQITKLDKEKSEALVAISELQETLIFSEYDELVSLNKDIEDTKNRLSALKSQTNPHDASISELANAILDDTDLKKEIEDLQERDTHCGYLVKLLTDPKSFVRKNIVDQYIPLVNKKINEYLQILGLSHYVEIAADLSVNIAYMGRYTSYYNMSQGERLRLNISTTMAFKDLMATLGKNSNMLFVDELFDGSLDPSGMYRSFKFVKERADHVWLISHRDELLDSVDKIMRVTKRDGFTTIAM